MHPNENAGMFFAETVERGQERMDRAFVYANGDVATLEAAKFANALLDFFAEIEHPIRIFQKQRAGVRERASARPAHEKRLSDPVLEFADRDAHCRLRAIEFFRGAREA